MSRNFGRSSSLLEHIKQIQKLECTQKYFAALKEIEQKIRLFKSRKSTNFNEWNRINKFILDKNNAIKYCVTNNYVSVDFYEDPDIKSFSEICTSDRKCNFNKTQAKKTFEPKAVKKGTCTGETNCEKPILSARAEKITPKTRSAERKSVTISLPGPDLKDQRQNATAEQESQSVNVNTQPQHSTANSVHSVSPNVEVPEQTANPDSRSSGPEEVQKHFSDVSDPPNEDKLGTEPRNGPLQTTFIQESNPSYSSQEKGTDENVHQIKLPTDDQANVDLVVQKENLVAPLPSAHIHDAVSDVEGDHSDGNSDNGVSTSVSYNGLDRVNGTSLGQPPDEVPTSADTTDSVQFDSKGVRDADTGKLVTDGEHAHVKALCNEIPGTQAIHNGDSCIKEQDNELVLNNGGDLGIFSNIFQVIQRNKDNMTNASIPIGIVLLLSLLFKYTPLWKVLTKKNKKKPAEMNQELHSVLQEPSILDEERSIAFSYGAFKYSS
ncbi:hypothetical protein, conserved [Plasmodium vivax]|nr:hypothetical protein, conserved [Plasmodium vivax]